LPQAVLLARLETIPERQQADRRAAIDELLDQGYGACWLRRPDLAQLVENALLHFDGERWRTLAWNVMPNHVHWLVEPLAGLSLAKLLQTVKGFTGREANRILGQTGAFWEREYHDRVIRDDQHLLNVIAYIHNNPVKSGLVKRAEDWRWSSAWGDRLGELPL
jgi:REP element-mobilizing transposase RayT